MGSKAFNWLKIGQNGLQLAQNGLQLAEIAFNWLKMGSMAFNQGCRCGPLGGGGIYPPPGFWDPYFIPKSQAASVEKKFWTFFLKEFLKEMLGVLPPPRI